MVPKINTWAGQRIAKLQVPFQDDEVMDGPPRCTAADFRTPRLQKCPANLTTIRWEERLGAGLDGCVWKVSLGESGPYILKAFWDAEPLPDVNMYFAAQRECQNAALLKMMQQAVADADASTPIVVNSNPKSQDEAMRNIYAFSDEGRGRPTSSGDSDLTTISSVPRMRECFGWLTISGKTMNSLHPWLLRPPATKINKIPRYFYPDKEYIAILYEYVEEGENDPVVVEEVINFLWLAGFSFTMGPAARNWKSGVLIDLSDIVHPGGFGWQKAQYRKRTGESVLVPEQW